VKSQFRAACNVEVTGGVEIVARQFSSRSPPGLSWLIDCREAVPIPNVVRATIAAEKLTAYLLNPSHKRGGAKARLLLSLGYRTDAPGDLESDLRTQHLSLDPERTRTASPTKSRDRLGRQAAELCGSSPSGRSILEAMCPIHYHVPEVAGMAFELYSDAILIRDVPERGLRAGDVGTLVDRHVVPGVADEGYSVEFFDMTGNTVAVVTVPASALRLPTPADRPAVRALQRVIRQSLTHRTETAISLLPSL